MGGDVAGARGRSARATKLIAYGTTSLGVSGVSLIAPVLPELGRDFEVTAEQMALFQTAVMLPGVVTAILTTRLIDVWGLRATLATALALFGAAGLTIAVVEDFRLAIALRLVQGMGSGGLVATAVVLLRSLPAAVHDRSIGTNAAIVSSMMVVQPLLGSSLGLMWVRSPFMFYGLALALAVVTWRTVTGDAARPVTHHGGRGLPRPRLLPVMVMTTLLNVTFFGWLLYLTPIMLESRGVGIGARGLVLGLQAGLATIVTLTTASLRGRGRDRVLLGGGWSVFVVAMLALTVTGSTSGVMAWLSVAGICYGVVNPILVVLASRSGVPTDVGWWQSSARLGQVLGPVVTGGLLGLASTALVLSVGALIGCTAVAVASARPFDQTPDQ